MAKFYRFANYELTSVHRLSSMPLRPSWTSAKSASCYARSFIKNLCITSERARAPLRDYIILSG